MESPYYRQQNSTLLFDSYSPHSFRLLFIAYSSKSFRLSSFCVNDKMNGSNQQPSFSDSQLIPILQDFAFWTGRNDVRKPEVSQVDHTDIR